MKMTLHPNGAITLPSELIERDELTAGDAFEVERIAPGNYLLTKSANSKRDVAIVEEPSGLLALRAPAGVITAEMVKTIEGQGW